MTTPFTTPIGRMVGGSVYHARDKDFQGNPLTIKSGPNIGQPRSEFYVGLAIAKAGEQHWAETEWGYKIWTEGHTAFSGGEGQRPDFAWKITDGDSQVVNRANVRPCDKEGYPGHWVLNFSSAFEPGLYSMVITDKPQQLVGTDEILPGYYIQIAGNVAGNNNRTNPGVYLNLQMVCLMGYGERIVSGPDVASAGFGGQLPPGASTTPVGGGFNPAPAPGFTPAAPPQGPGQPQVAQPAHQTPVAPSVPSAGGAPDVPSAGVVPGVPQQQTPQGQQFLAPNR